MLNSYQPLLAAPGWLPKLNGVLPLAYANFARTQRYWYNGRAYPGFDVWLTAQGGSFSRASTGGTNYGVEGVYVDGANAVYSRNNMWLDSNLFSSGNWVAAPGCTFTVAHNVTDPFGVANNAWTYTVATVNVGDSSCQFGPNYNSKIANTSWIASVYVKKGTSDWVGFQANDASNTNGRITYFNLAAGAIGTVGAAVGSPANTISDATMTDVGGGWYRISFVSSGSFMAATDIGPVNADNNRATTVGKTFLLCNWMAEQIRVGQVWPSPYLATDNSTRGDARIAPATGLMIEGAASNVLTYTTAFTNAAWTSTNCTTLDNQAAAPDGTTSAASLVGTTADGACKQAFTATVSTIYTFSIWMRTVTGSFSVSIFGVDDSGNNSTSCALTTDWKRFSVARTCANANFKAQIGGASTLNTSTNIYVWGAQLESTSTNNPTGYVSAESTAHSRNADNLQLGLSEMATGTVFYRGFGGNSAANFGRVLGTVGASGRYSLGVGTTAAISDGTTVLQTANSITLGDTCKGASSWSAAGRCVCLNGGAVATDTTVMGTGSIYQVGGNNLLTKYLYGAIIELGLWDFRASNGELQRITAG